MHLFPFEEDLQPECNQRKTTNERNIAVEIDKRKKKEKIPEVPTCKSIQSLSQAINFEKIDSFG